MLRNLGLDEIVRALIKTLKRDFRDLSTAVRLKFEEHSLESAMQVKWCCFGKEGRVVRARM